VGARLVDRFGTRTLLALACAHAAGLLTLVALGSIPAPAAALIPVSLITGMALPPTSSVMRALYPRLLHDEPALVQGAYALDSVLTETIFITGPLLTAALVALVQPAAALVLSAAAALAGVTLFLAVLPKREPEEDIEPRRLGRLGALAAPGIRTLVLSMLPVGFAFGSLEVALPAFAQDQGRPELAGLLIAIWSVGSVAGGLVYGARRWGISLAQVHVRVALLVPLGFLPLALASSTASMALLVLPAGMFIAPLIATRNELAGVVAPAGSETEAFTWPLTALVAGVSLGAAVAGGIVQSGSWRTAVIVGACAAAAGGAISLSRRATLQPA
jgi:MFS family permease